MFNTLKSLVNYRHEIMVQYSHEFLGVRLVEVFVVVRSATSEVCYTEVLVY